MSAENEAVERMAVNLSLAFCGQWDRTDERHKMHMRDVARVALSEHPAVLVLQELMEGRGCGCCETMSGRVWDKASAVLAAIPKE